ncbi:hypothetical protein M0R89_01415 [Halorussus limi]|uniref:Uncharacterized protein n=1 Tax=Halorussus limi TaxID=2938695 RepID=A0A8U0HVU9_9EURY|nr:hypothetical protein [Halorussus limi]UPV74744.1 hypothetical protein M0R89_01415 [Halorussus limi]
MVDDSRTQNRRQYLKTLGAVGCGLAGVVPAASSASALPNDELVEATPASGHAKRARAAGIDAVTVTKRDGGYEQTVSASAVGPVEYDLRVDLENATYEVVDLTAGVGELNVATEPNTATVSPDGTSQNYDLSVQYTTHNQYEYKLCRTTHWLEWYYHSNYDATIMNDRTVTPRTWSARNWYTEESKFTDLSESSSECFSEAFGKHYNDKYGGDHKRTYSEHTVQITGHSNGTSDYNTSAYHYGEGSSYLHTNTVVN